MMQDSDMEAEQNPSQSDLSMTSVDIQRAASSPNFERSECQQSFTLIRTLVICYHPQALSPSCGSRENYSLLSLSIHPGVRSLSVAELNERLEETEMSIRSLSDELVQQLALRDELDFEKEVKNSFISALIDVQNRQKEHRELQKKKKKLKGGGGALQEQGKRTLGSVRAEAPMALMRAACSHASCLPVCSRLTPLCFSALLLLTSALQRGGTLLCHSEQFPANFWERVQRETGFFTTFTF